MPEEKPVGIGLRIAAHWLVHGFAATCVLIVLCPLAGGYVEFYERTDALLPLMTQWLVDLSGFMSAFWFLVFPAVGLLDIAVVLVIGLSKNYTLLRFWATMILLIAVAFLTLGHVGLYMPLHERGGIPPDVFEAAP